MPLRLRNRRALAASNLYEQTSRIQTRRKNPRQSGSKSYTGESWQYPLPTTRRRKETNILRHHNVVSTCPRFADLPGLAPAVSANCSGALCADSAPRISARTISPLTFRTTRNEFRRRCGKVRKIGKRKRFLMEQFFIGVRTAAMRAPFHRVLAPRREDLGRTHILASSTLDPRVRQIELEGENIFAVCDVLLFRI